MIEEINTQKPEFMVQDGAIRLMKVKATSVGKETFFTDRDAPALKTFFLIVSYFGGRFFCSCERRSDE